MKTRRKKAFTAVCILSALLLSLFASCASSTKDLHIVNLGDSIFGNIKDKTSISAVISKKMRATVYNCGFGGCEMSKREDVDWNEFSMYRIAEAIASGDFSGQEAIANAGIEDIPAYFAETVEILKGIDFNSIDIITVAYGLNDFTSEAHAIDNADDKYDLTTPTGALRYSVEKISKAYPHIKIVIITPIFRVWFEENTEIMLYTSDEHVINGYTLPDLSRKLAEVASEYSLPCIDAYNELGINEENYHLIYENGDGAHPNKYGRKLYGKLIAKKLTALYEEIEN